MPHPLLSEDLLSIKSGADVFSNEGDKKEENTEGDDMCTAFGTLAISDIGATRFIGRLGADVR